ncbi:hypothetical protein [Texcoconibacillus texcoconensis]|uniref:Uncharacterized protein n=1 Tax=Texcoconibacillus texcoconensis TaxID=1095777 RepID=A0A840QSP5_9BACI|nr:hypothetical protein [Texcoconibacillus texcoconensis]MBB5174546.1 hypothetical protein [Texcoconibacillus texcoconensis]
MTQELHLMYIRPEDIDTFYHDPVSEQTARKRVRSLNNIAYRNYELVVERLSFQHYVLIEGFEKYSALIQLQPDQPVFCHVIDTSNERERLIRILNKVITFEKTSWFFRHTHIKKLMTVYHMSTKDIASAINQPESTVKNFLWREGIPEYIQTLAKRNQASMTLLNDIARSRVLYDSMRIHLFERAVLPKKDRRRLKERHFEHVKLFCKNFSLKESEINDQTFISSLTESLIAGDDQLIFWWRHLLRRLRGRSVRRVYLKHWDKKPYKN